MTILSALKSSYYDTYLRATTYYQHKICINETIDTKDVKIIKTLNNVENLIDIGLTKTPYILVIISDAKILESNIRVQTEGEFTVVYSTESNTLYRFNTLEPLNGSNFIFANTKSVKDHFLSSFENLDNSYYCLGKRGSKTPIAGTFETYNNQTYKPHHCGSLLEYEKKYICDRSLQDTEYNFLFRPKEGKTNIIRGYTPDKVFIDFSKFVVQPDKLTIRQEKNGNIYKPDNTNVSFGKTILIFDGIEAAEIANNTFISVNKISGVDSPITLEYLQ